MKQKLIALTKPLLVASMAFSWWIYGGSVTSLFLLGEYPYPTKEEEE